MNYPKLGKAPIILAILQIQYRLKNFVNNQTFSDIKPIREKYPIVNQSNSAQIEFNPNNVKTPVALKSFTNDGYSFSSKDGLKSLSISNNAFTFQLAAPYTKWSDFFKEAIEGWILCGLEDNVEIVLSQSIRYVNTFEITVEKNIIEPSEYFNSYLVVNPKYPDYTRYLFQYSIPLDAEGVIAHIGTEIRESTTNVFPFVFDIDVICLKSQEYNIAKVKEMFEKLREYKNSIFFSTLKEKTINLFK